MRGIRFAIINITIMLTLIGCTSSQIMNPAPSASPSILADSKLAFTMLMTTSRNKHAEQSEDVNQEKWVLKLEELTNTDLDIMMIPLNDIDSQMSLLFAGNNFPEIVQNVGGAAAGRMSLPLEAGVFMPLDELLQEHAPNLMKTVPKDAWEGTSLNGKIYGIPSWLSNPSWRALFIRTDLLEQTGLPAPQTVDELLDVMRAMKKNGVEFPYQMRENFKYADTILGAFDVLPTQFELQGKEVVPKFFDIENMSKALNVYKTMYDEGLIPENFATLTSSDYSENIVNGRAGIWSANAQLLPSYRMKLRETAPDAKLDIVASPRGPENFGGHLLSPSVNTSYYINSHVAEEKAIRIIKFFEWMLTSEAEEYFLFGIEGETYTKENGIIQFTAPTEPKALDEDRFRALFWLAHDMNYNRAREELTQDGRDMMSAIDTTLSKEGLGTIRFSPILDSFLLYPELAPPSGDVGPKFIIDYMVKMIYGKEPIENWPKVIEEYKKRGGLDIIKEATARYNSGEGLDIANNR